MQEQLQIPVLPEISAEAFLPCFKLLPRDRGREGKQACPEKPKQLVFKSKRYPLQILLRGRNALPCKTNGLPSPGFSSLM